MSLIIYRLKKWLKRLMIIGLPLFFIIIMILSMFATVANNNKSNSCESGSSSVISAGGHIFPTDYVVLQPWGKTAWSTGGGAWMYAATGGRHTGIDVQAIGDEDGSKNTPVLSMKPGVVHGVGSDNIGGNWIVVQHNDREFAYYGHVKDGSIKVKVGDKIQQGTVLAIMGATGPTGGIYHVHFEIRTTPDFMTDVDPSKIFGKDHVEQTDIFHVQSDGKTVTRGDTAISKSKHAGNTCSTNTSLKGSKNMEKMWYFFKSKGYTDEATAGIIGSAMAESSEDLDPNMQQVGGPARGIFQWESQNPSINGGYRGQADSRFDKLYAWAKQNKKDPFDIATQLEYAYLEMTDSQYDSTTYNLLNEPEFKKLRSIAEATTKFTRSFERAGIEAMAKRLNYAQSVYNEMKGKK